MARVLITGTSKGIGYDAALNFARKGHDVAATMRNPNNSDLAEAAAREKLPIDIHVMDVQSDESVESAFAEIGDIDALVNNAGILSMNTIEDESVENFSAVMNTNFMGAVRCCKAAIPRMRERRNGCIINISSVAGKIAASPQAAYASSKHALEAFSECLAQEMYAFGVRVYLVEPGIISTPMATTELPLAEANSVYPQGRRMHALFKFAGQAEAPAALVSDILAALIDNGSDRFRHPIGPDSLIFLGYRTNTGDERFISTWGNESDQTFLDNVRNDVMMDLSAFLD
ncbi:MAG TPA: SDR family NAD(P)-dependent oxidoreductase [Pseudomonadales bacterium]|nr:SDR family NAD(P)-dependent oxidoreductase [Pseudomonadales bacterium]